MATNKAAARKIRNLDLVDRHAHPGAVVQTDFGVGKISERDGGWLWIDGLQCHIDCVVRIIVPAPGQEMRFAADGGYLRYA